MPLQESRGSPLIYVLFYLGLGIGDGGGEYFRSREVKMVHGDVIEGM